MDRVEAKYVRKKKPSGSGSGSEGNDVANFDLDERCIATLANREQFITICEMCSPRVARWCVCMYVYMYTVCMCVCMYVYMYTVCMCVCAFVWYVSELIVVYVCESECVGF